MMNRLNDKRVKKILVLDVETIGVGEKAIFDIGYIICDKKGNKFIKKSYLIKEVFEDKKRMEKAYYFNKYPKYLQGIKEGTFIVETWENVMREMWGLIKKYDIKQISAYNLSFDLGAIEFTNKELRGKEFRMFDKLEKQCIYGLAVETICQQKTYQKQFHDKKIFTASGKFLSGTAESVWKYCQQKFDFVEEHMGIFDCEIEVDIMARCYRQNKKFTKGILNAPYRKLQVKDEYFSSNADKMF